MQAKSLVAALLAASAIFSVHAHDLSIDECTEGGDFIKHAALSRDSGLSRDDFISRLHGDLIAIQAFPPELRWFVQDEEDEVLLVSHAERVFDDPESPESHQTDFLQACFDRIAEQAAARDKVQAAQASDTAR
ncbi:MAG: hypothetical protein KIS79_11700 [Burkholderiales bacterium]|nr:hypothetical protein [Burkholderiales bacterium]